MPAATLRPAVPRQTTAPPVMYSQQWSPTPSTTASAMLLRTAKRSPAPPRATASHMSQLLWSKHTMKPAQGPT